MGTELCLKVASQVCLDPADLPNTSCLDPPINTCNHRHLRFVYILRLNQSSRERVPPERLWISAREAEAASGGAFRSPEAIGSPQPRDTTKAVLQVFMERQRSIARSNVMIHEVHI